MFLSLTSVSVWKVMGLFPVHRDSHAHDMLNVNARLSQSTNT